MTRRTSQQGQLQETFPPVCVDAPWGGRLVRWGFVNRDARAAPNALPLSRERRSRSLHVSPVRPRRSSAVAAC